MLELTPVFEAPGLQLGAVFDVSGPPAFVSVEPSANGATVTYTGAANRYRVDGGAAVVVPSNPFSFFGLSPNTEPHTVELSNDGGATWPASWTFGTTNPGTGTGDIPSSALAQVSIAAAVLHRVTAAVQVQLVTPPAGADVDVAVSATVLHRVTAAVAVYSGTELPALTPSTRRRFIAYRSSRTFMSTTRPVVTATPMDVAEADNIAFDFTRELDDGETLMSAPAPTVTCEWHSGPADEQAATRITGAPQISGGLVVQSATGGLPGTTYLLRCTVTTSSGRKLVIPGLLPFARLGTTLGV